MGGVKWVSNPHVRKNDNVVYLPDVECSYRPNSGVVGGHLVELCRKTGDGMCGLVGDAFSIGSPPGLCQWAGVSPIGKPCLLDSSV